MSKKEEAVQEVQAQEAAQPQAQETAIVASQPSEAAPHAIAVRDEFSGRNVQLYSSIQDDGTRESKIKIYNAMNETTGKLSDQVNITLEISDLVAFPVEIVTEDGELVNAMRIILVTPDGDTYASVATGVYSSLQKIIGIVGPAPWNPPLKLTPINQPTRRGFKTLTIRLVP